jgi:hypothetical protein
MSGAAVSKFHKITGRHTKIRQILVSLAIFH